MVYTTETSFTASTGLRVGPAGADPPNFITTATFDELEGDARAWINLQLRRGEDQDLADPVSKMIKQAANCWIAGTTYAAQANIDGLVAAIDIIVQEIEFEGNPDAVESNRDAAARWMKKALEYIRLFGNPAGVPFVTGAHRW